MIAPAENEYAIDATEHDCARIDATEWLANLFAEHFGMDERSAGILDAFLSAVDGARLAAQMMDEGTLVIGLRRQGA